MLVDKWAVYLARGPLDNLAVSTFRWHDPLWWRACQEVDRLSAHFPIHLRHVSKTLPALRFGFFGYMFGVPTA